MQHRVVMLYSMSFQPYQGWYRRVYNQARALVEAGCDVELLAWDRECGGPEQENRDGIRIRRFAIPAGTSQGPRNGINHLRFAQAVLRYLRRHDFDIVHCFNVDTMPAGLRVARRRGAKAVLDLCEPEYYRGFWKKRYAWLLHGVNWVEKTLAKRFDHLLVHNTYQMEKFRRAGISRMTQIGSYPGRELLVAAPRAARTDRVVVGRLGTAYANNGFEELTAAFRQLLDRHAGDTTGVQYKLRLAGKVFENYQSTFDRLVEPLGDHVEVTGAFDVAELPQLYAEIDISLLLYGVDAFRHVTPTKLFESMACGVPVVATAIGDVPQILEEGRCGVLVDQKDPHSICDGIEQLVSDAELRQTMSAKAMSLARKKYTWEAIKSKFLGVYDSL